MGFSVGVQRVELFLSEVLALDDAEDVGNLLLDIQVSLPLGVLARHANW